MPKFVEIILVLSMLALPISIAFAHETGEENHIHQAIQEFLEEGVSLGGDTEVDLDLEEILDENSEVVDEEKEIELEILNEKFLEAKSSATEAQDDLRSSLNETSYLQRKLNDITEQILSLEDQLGSLDGKIEALNDDIKETKERIEELDEQLEKTSDEITELDENISYYTEQLLFIVQALFFESDKAGFFDGDELQTMKVLLAEDDVDLILEEAENISMLENYLQITLENLEDKKQELNNLFEKFQNLKANKVILRDNLERENVELKIQRIAKDNLLEASKGEQRVYEELIRKSKEEEAVIRQEIISQISKYKDFKSLIDSLSGSENIEDDATYLSWPVSPSLGISAGFKDPSYKAALGIEHYAIDLPVFQGSSVGAAAPGVVFKVKGGEGNDYHYILIGHSNGLMTLYGHMYDIFVEEGQAIERGEVIGLSGGAPGTRGAGYLTTGAHLHFEVIKDGVHVDPIPYMDPERSPGN